MHIRFRPDALSDTTINIQGFVFNTYGAIDKSCVDLREGTRNADPGQPAGLGPDSRQTFSAEFQAYLAGLDDWMKFLAKLRHALAHRISSTSRLT